MVRSASSMALGSELAGSNPSVSSLGSAGPDAVAVVVGDDCAGVGAGLTASGCVVGREGGCGGEGAGGGGGEGAWTAARGAACGSVAGTPSSFASTEVRY